jgi:hypothetical protein
VKTNIIDMQATSATKLYTLSYSQMKTYMLAMVFVVGNILLPQLCHLIPQGGMIFLPIYFFTLVGAYKYGWKVGLMTAVLSPVLNSVLFGMPVVTLLPIILLKSVLLAFSAGIAARRFNCVSLPILLLVVLSYQVVGTLAEWGFTGDFMEAVQDFRLGVPGMLVQVILGFIVIKYLFRK